MNDNDQKKIVRARQKYLLCKTLIQRRKDELKLRQLASVDATGLERMIAKLERSAQRHRAILNELTCPKPPESH